MMQSYSNPPEFSTLPEHIGIIMDGNGRWARQRKHPRVFGHQSAVKSVRDTVEICAELGVKYLTLYAFSTENWLRPKAEVHFLMKLFDKFLKEELSTMVKNNIQFRLLGKSDRLPHFVQKSLFRMIETTRNHTGLKLCLAVDYGARTEITNACAAIAQKIKDNELQVEDINEELISNHLYIPELPDVDLVIRTSGELRLSNFLLWQVAYSEFYYTDVLWPDFGKEDLYKALSSFSQRTRRMGKVS